MVSRAYAKAKGSKAESLVADCYVRAGHVRGERRARHGNKDRGDVGGIDYVCTEVKAESNYAGKLATWLAEADVETLNAGADVGIVWHKRKGTTDPLQWYVTMWGETWLKVLKGYQEWKRSTSP